jgi:hypothetical protein
LPCPKDPVRLSRHSEYHRRFRTRQALFDIFEPAGQIRASALTNLALQIALFALQALNLMVLGRLFWLFFAGIVIALFAGIVIALFAGIVIIDRRFGRFLGGGLGCATFCRLFVLFGASSRGWLANLDVARCHEFIEFGRALIALDTHNYSPALLRVKGRSHSRHFGFASHRLGLLPAA